MVQELEHTSYKNGKLNDAQADDGDKQEKRAKSRKEDGVKWRKREQIKSHAKMHTA